MILKQHLNSFVKIFLKIRENAMLISFLMFLISLILLISSFRTVTATIIPFKIFLFVLLGALIISILLTLLDFRINSLVKKLGLIKYFEVFLYFSLIVFIFFKFNFFVSFNANDNCFYENCKSKITHNILGQPIYNIYIYDHQWDDWSASGWINVDSATFYGTGDFIKINYNIGIFGFKVIPKNQSK